MTGRKVVVLAKAGAACDRTVTAVRQSGAELLATLDPASVAEADVRASAPEALLVVLDAATEAALGKFDDLFADPTLEVLFDDAEVAAKRTGWEEARWARHLKAKLSGSGNVLPEPVGGAAGDGGFEAEMQALTLAVATLPSEPMPSRHAPKLADGCVVIVAGVGGPDAVRQLLGALPAGFPRALLLRQRIEGAQYDRLVRQMQRATPLPVLLAQPGDVPQHGTVHVLPDGVDVETGEAGLVFAAANGEPRFAALRQSDSAMLLLSGADPAMVDVALTLSLAGGLALGQAPENCFDSTATQALVARGGDSRSLTIMARQLLERWSP
ncbi:chemotaxis protein CheB [Thermomonas sp.]|uniref:chemotaxis protein CheB n=1 Tax=Thermomonas sp. TaxID=1971895 RepID=UPI002C23C2BF|nr:chemotaxis protein CheB [Thermomonas sp.]HRO63086.1 chemotaxis protein CheB [Thermomonas sp.]